jgi:beta-xylosidase
MDAPSGPLDHTEALLRHGSVAPRRGRQVRHFVLLFAFAVFAGACVPLAPPSQTPGLYGAAAAVYARDFPDPTVVSDGAGGFLALSTNSIYGPYDLPLVPTAHTVCAPGPTCDASTLLTSWTRGNPTDALARPPAWQRNPYNPVLLRNWAPAVHQYASGWVLYFVAPDPSGDQCIGAATSPTVAGPYQPVDAGPIECDFGGGGSIDPTVVVDPGGNPWLVWKNDGNCCQLPVQIHSQQLTPDGLALVSGTRADLIGVDQAWEDGSQGGSDPWKKVVEAPAMVQDGAGSYLLFYSANDYDSASYAIGYAVCAHVNGPCTKPHNGPLVGNSAVAAGPGGEDTFVDASGQRWLVYHAWSPNAVGTQVNGTRSMRLSRLDVSSATPVVGAGP